jgi:hypothetical protein
MCQEHSMMGQGSMTETAMVEMWELLTEEQKKKVAVTRMDIFIKIFEIKISGMEKMIEIKRETITDIKKVQEMLKQ